MSKGGRRAPRSSFGRQAAVLVAVVAVGALLVYALARDGGDEVVGGARTCEPVSGFSDLHGIAVDPERANVLHAATHHGLFRATDDKDWCRVGTMRDDLMGFTAHPTNGSVFWVSGHPADGGNMGVRQSTDGGYTWRFLALRGVDFHGMTVSPADPDRLWGSWSGRVYRSDDGGKEWDVVSDAPGPLRSFAPDPASSSTVYAVTTAGIHKSTDGGAHWQAFSREPWTALALVPGDPDLMFAGRGPAVWRSTDAGATWQPLTLSADRETVAYISVAGQDADTVYAGTYETGIYKTTDGGTTWSRVKAPS